MPHPHIVELDEAFITPFARDDRLDITKLLEFATNFVVINRLTRSRIPQGDDQSTLKSLVWYEMQEGMWASHST